MAIRPFDEPGLGFLIFEFDFIADQGQHAAGGAICHRTDRQLHLGSFGTANEMDDFFQFHVHDIHRRLVALCDGDNIVAFLELFAFFRRTARNDLVNFAVTIVVAELCADAKKREAHADGKILRVVEIEVIRMGVVGMRQRVEIRLQNIRAVPVHHQVQIPAVMPRQGGGDFRRGGFGQR